jgi:hypothetical protein
MGFKVPQHWGILGAKISIHDRAKYMSALVAIQHNPVIKTFYQKLLQAGKAKKVALIACAHKLLGFLHAIVKSQKPWRCPENIETRGIKRHCARSLLM